MSNRSFDEVGATQVIHRNEPGAIASAVSASASLVFIIGAVGVAWQADNILKGIPPSGDFVTAWVRAGIGAAALPFVGVAWGKLAYVRGKLEGDLYRATGWKFDLDGDGRTGEAEIAEQRPDLRAGLPNPAQVVRLIKVNTQREPVLELHDERGLPEGRIREFITRGRVIGLGVVAWRREGWTQEEWETARDMLAEFGVATPRLDGQRGNWLVGVQAALDIMRIAHSPAPLLDNST